jgi:hypothetical protein
MERLKIIYNNKSKLIIKKTMSGQLLSVGGVLFSIIVGYFIISTSDFGKMELMIVCIIFLSILISAYKPIKTIISREYFSFDQIFQTIHHNKKLKATFNEVEYIELIDIDGGSEGRDSCLLNLRLKDNTSIQIDDNPDRNETRKIAGEIATFINKEIKSK